MPTRYGSRTIEGYYRRKLWISGLVILSLALILIPIFILGVATGSKAIPLNESLLALTKLFNNPAEGRSTVDIIVMEIRVPRTLSAMLVGAALAVGGVALQSLFRNPLAEPYILGISAGSSLGAILAVTSGLVYIQALGAYTVSMLAFLGALMTTAVIYAIASRIGFKPTTILLLGLAVSFVVSSISSLLQYLHNKDALILLTLLLGSFSTSNWIKLNVLIITVPIGVAVTFLMAKELNAILMGEDYAKQIGVNVKNLTERLVIITSLLTSVSVAVAGIIGFVGILVPHIARFLVGLDHKVLIPASALMGATILSLSDVLSRYLLRPAELPVGIVTSLMGAPVLVYLLFKLRGSS